MIQISKYNKQHPLRVFEAFAGYGSQSLAFKYLKEKHPEFDFKVVGFSEIEFLPCKHTTYFMAGIYLTSEISQE